MAEAQEMAAPDESTALVAAPAARPFVIDGRLVHGHKGIAAHIGHIRLMQDGPRCSCGASGCFEALASGTALQARAATAAQKSPFLAAAARDGGVAARHVFDGARAGVAARAPGVAGGHQVVIE